LFRYLHRNGKIFKNIFSIFYLFWYLENNNVIYKLENCIFFQFSMIIEDDKSVSHLSFFCCWNLSCLTFNCGSRTKRYKLLRLFELILNAIWFYVFVCMYEFNLFCSISIILKRNTILKIFKIYIYIYIKVNEKLKKFFYFIPFISIV